MVGIRTRRGDLMKKACVDTEQDRPHRQNSGRQTSVAYPEAAAPIASKAADSGEFSIWTESGYGRNSDNPNDNEQLLHIVTSCG